MLFAVISVADVRAQVLPAGAWDDPRENIQDVWWRHENRLEVGIGPSLIARQWRAAAHASYDVVTPGILARFSGSIRAGMYGAYEPDVDEWYDLVRLVEFVRINQSRSDRFHARIGAQNRMFLGTGHLVNFYNTTTAWDHRTVGAEMGYRGRFIDVDAFIDDVRADGVTGGRLGIRPFAATSNPRTQSFEAGFSAVTDLGTWRDERTSLIGYNIDLSFMALGSPSLFLRPFASFAWYTHYGSGLGFGASARSDDFIDVARFHVTAALFYNGRRFIPGYVGTFYTVNNDRARILRSDEYLVGERVIDPEGTTLDEARGGTDLLTDFRLVVFERFELWFNFRRHYGTRPLSEQHFRLFVNAPDRFRLNMGIDRGSLRGFWSIFRTIGDRTTLVFGTDYRVSHNFWAFVDARYTYDMVETMEDGTNLYLVQRRFEPIGGLRVRF